MAAPAAGAADGAGSRLAEGASAPEDEDVAELEAPGVLGFDCSEPSSPEPEHPATSNDSATSAAIRIPQG